MFVKAFTSLDKKLDSPYFFAFKAKDEKAMIDYIADWLNRSQNPEASVKMAIEYQHATGFVFCWNYISDSNNWPTEDNSEEAI